MIARADAGDREAFFELLRRDPLFGGRIATAFDCWGGHPGACGFYRVGRSAALLVQGGGALLCGAPEDDGAEELVAFLHFAGAGRLCSRRTCPPGWLRRELIEMELRPAAAPAEGPLRGPPCRRRAAGAASLAVAAAAERPAARRRPGRLVCRRLRPTGAGAGADLDGGAGRDAVGHPPGLYSLRPEGAYLTAVETLPAARGRGFATALVAGLCRAAARPVRLLCEAPLRGFYERLGFAACGTALEAVCPPGEGDGKTIKSPF